jgi:hypothetical protein
MNDGYVDAARPFGPGDGHAPRSQRGTLYRLIPMDLCIRWSPVSTSNGID